MPDADPPIRIGLPQWFHAAWPFTPRSTDALHRYSRLFDTVEGNTTFYGLPKPDTVRRWREAVPASFRFCFKFPRAISHDAQLQHCSDETTEFLTRLDPVQGQLGILWLQLGPRFGPAALPALRDYLASLPSGYHYGVEVRHPAFFGKGDDERALNRLLADNGVNRTVRGGDTRGSPQRPPQPVQRPPAPPRRGGAPDRTGRAVLRPMPPPLSFGSTARTLVEPIPPGANHVRLPF